MNNYTWQFLIVMGVGFTALKIMVKIKDVNKSALKDTGIASL